MSEIENTRAISDIESIRTWLRTCPEIDGNSPFTVDYFDDDPTHYAIYAVPSAITYKKDILGNVYEAPIQTKIYYFSVSMPASEDAAVMMENQESLNSLIDWLATQNLNKNLPEPTGMDVQSVIPTLTPYALQPNSNSMTYRISLQMTYRKE